MRFTIAAALALLLALVAGGTAAPKQAASKGAGLQRKLDYLDANARKPHPDTRPTVLSEQEINDYLASGQVTMPEGVQSVKLEGAPGVITGKTRVDFDKVREGIHSSNPLLGVFSGIHDVEVVAHAYGKGGQGDVHVDSVALDGVEVPNFILELFVEKYLTSRYPEIGMDSQFSLPDRIDSAVVGTHQVTLIQR